MKEYFEKNGHVCELSLEGDPESCPWARTARFRQLLVKWTTIDSTSNLTLQHFNSHWTIFAATKFHLKNHPTTIHPFSRFTTVWEGVMMIVFLCALIYDPLQYLDYIVDFEDNVGDMPINKLVKAFCIVDMMIRFFTGYLDERKFEIVLSKKTIGLKYLRGLFIFDFLTNVPFFIGLVFHMDRYITEFHFVKMLTLFRFCRLPTVIRYFQRMLVRIGIAEKYLEMSKLLCFWVICIHWAACLHILPGLIVSLFKHDVKVNAWYEKGVFKNHGVYGKYVICLYKSVKTFMGTGFINDLQPTEYFDKVYASLLTIVGRVGLCVTLAHIYEILQGVMSSTLRYDEMMVQLNKFTDQNNLPPRTKAKLKNNYEYLFRKRYFNEEEILKTVSVPLRQQILIHNTRQLVENSPFFENLPSSLVMKIISTLSVELFLEGDVIYTMGEIGLSVFFITSGSVAFYSPSGKEVCHFSDGDYFGEMSLVSDAEHHYTKVVALETTECYKLGKNDFQKLIQSYPDLLQKVETLAIERIEKVLMIEEREKHRKAFRYTSINPEQFPSYSRRSTNISTSSSQ